jgi:hypothetical protein
VSIEIIKLGLDSEMTFTSTLQRFFIFAVLIAMLTMFAGCTGIAEGNFVKHVTDESVEQPDVIYYVLATDVSEADEESGTTSSGEAQECHLLPFDKQPTKDPHGKHHYYARKMTEADWYRCDDFDDFDEPPLVVNSIPDELMDEFGFEKMELRFEK